MVPMRGSRKLNGGGGGGSENFLLSSTYFREWTSLEKQLNPRSPFASIGGPCFLTKHIAACNFQLGVRTPCPPPLDPPMVLIYLLKSWP